MTSLARPGGNITGFSVDVGAEIEAKRLQLLKEILPETGRVAFLGLKSNWESPAGEKYADRCADAGGDAGPCRP